MTNRSRTSPPIRVGVIGIGFGQHVHVPAFRRDDRCDVVAVCATSAARAASVAAELGIPRFFGDWRELVADPAIDAVSVAVPPAAQAEIAMAAIANGKHVFCEKPLATNAAQAASLLVAATTQSVAHSIDFMFPELPAWRSAKELLDRGAIGAVRHAVLQWRVETYAFRTKSASWKTRPEDGGGTVSNFIPHAMYNIEWLLGPVRQLAARIAPSGGVSDVLVDAWLELESGCPVTLSVATDAVAGTGHRLEIYGDTGAMALINDSASYADGFRLDVAGRSTAWTKALSNPSGESVDRLAGVAPIVRRFIDDIVNGSVSRPNFDDGVRVQRLVDAVRVASAVGGWVSTARENVELPGEARSSPGLSQ